MKGIPNIAKEIYDDIIFINNNNNNTVISKCLEVAALQNWLSIFIIKPVFREESQKQWQVISKIISNNLIVTKQESGKLRKEINDLQLQKVSSLLKMYLKKKFQKLKGPFASLYLVHIIKHVLIVFY